MAFVNVSAAFVVLILLASVKAQVWQVTSYWAGTQCTCPFVAPAIPNATTPNGSPCPAVATGYFCTNTTLFFNNAQCYACRGGDDGGGVLNATLVSPGLLTVYIGATCIDPYRMYSVPLGVCTNIDGAYDINITEVAAIPGTIIVAAVPSPTPSPSAGNTVALVPIISFLVTVVCLLY